jgi:hypothetical protein
MKKLTTALSFIISSFSVTAQTGSLTVTFTPSTAVQKSVIIKVSKPVFKFDDTYGYWFINPHNNAKHLQLSPPQGYGGGDAAFITFNGQGDDLDLYQFGDDSDRAVFKNNGFDLRPPTYDRVNPDRNKPLHIHFTVFTASEVTFTISGNASIESEAGNGSDLGVGAINGSGHFYREAKYAKTESLPGCDCDPTIYGTNYSKSEYTRTMSGCENAFCNKIFDAVQKSFAPMYSTGHQGNSGAAAGEILINPLPGHVNTNVPVKERPWCSSDYYHMRSTNFTAEQKIFNNDDGYGVRFMQMPDNSMLGGGGQNSLIESMKSLQEQMKAGKITSAEYMQQLSALSNKKENSGPDLKKEEKELNLYVSLIINPENGEGSAMKFVGKASVLHNVPGSAFELFTPIIKDDDGWISDKYYIYLGKFSQPAAGKNLAGFNAELTKPFYPPNAPKLAVYNIIIKMEGGKALIDKALAVMDVSALEALITNNN